MKNNTMSLGLQSFDSNLVDDNSTEGVEGEEGTKGTQGTEGDQSQNQNSGEKTFTQSEVNAIGTREKNQGKNSILKIFGCSDEKAAKEQAKAFKEWQESQKTEEQKRTEAEESLKNSAAESDKRAQAAENKLSALAAGVTNDSLDDALAIALLKVTEEKPLDKVLEEMKKEPRYSGFFGKGSSSGGTGSSADHNNNNGSSGSKTNLGARLAQNKLSGMASKSNFFKN